LWNEPATPRELPEQRPGQWGRRDALGETGNQRGFLSYLRPFHPTWDHELEERLVKQFDLPLDRKLKHLSRGMRMKAALASALAFRPKLIVLDEPFSGLDPLVRDEFIAGALEISDQEKWTIFISSHDINEVEQLADWVGIVEAGRLTLSEPNETLLGRFRRIEISGHESELNSASAPETWLEVEQVGNVLRAIETRYCAETFEDTCRRRLKATEFVARPMTLRQIFVSVAREGRAHASTPAA